MINIKSVKKQEITTTVDGVVEKKDGLLICTLQDNSNLYVPVNTANRHYAEILEWVAEGNTIEEAD
tara:strand:+ start:1208 stop:1405 length:198 start_codon:yes stop_codon:yes gene_type:complete